MATSTEPGLSAAERSDERATATAYGVLERRAGLANRWTFYIGKDGKIFMIDKEVKLDTSAQDMAGYSVSRTIVLRKATKK